MNVTDFEKAQGHWILAKMGKKVLRPGGRELTTKLIQGLNINPKDDIAEFAPGLGFTANLTLQNHPHSYTGIDADENAVQRLQQKIKGTNVRFKLGNAANSELPDGQLDKVYGEAMLTMHADHRKSEIIREAHRILKKGGLYAIHELGLTPEELSDEKKSEIQRELAVAIKVNARPLTVHEWKALLEKEGFKIKSTMTNPMHLLKTKRIIADEGIFRFLKISYNIMTTPAARKRILEMASTFKKHQCHMNAVAIIAEKV